jgi:hypothetical protein
LNNKPKDKNEITMNGILAQTNGGIGNKSDNKRGCGKTNKFSSIIYQCFICNSIEHKIYNFFHKDVAQTMFAKKAMAYPRNKMLLTWFW